MSLGSKISRMLGREAGAKRSLVAIDVGTRAVHAVRAKNEGGTLVLEGFRVVHGVGRDTTVADALREVLELRLAREPVAIAISSPEVTIRRIEVPPMTPKELREALPWEARRHIAGLSDDAILDAQVLSAQSSDGNGPMGVVLVAIPRALYDEITDTTSTLGISTEFIDVGALAAMNAVLRDRADFVAGPVALLELSADVGWFSIFAPNDLTLFRDLGQRAEQIDRALAAHFALDPPQLDVLHASGKLPHGAAAAPADVQKALAMAIAEIVEDLRSAILYLESRAGASLDRVRLTGSHAALLERFGIPELVSQQSGVALERWDPIERFTIRLVDRTGLAAASSELAAVAGLVARFFQGA